MTRADKRWQAAGLAARYVDGVRGAIPHADEQIDVMLRLIGWARPEPANVLDLGCGDGILGRAVLDRFPGADCVFADFSSEMLDLARGKLDAMATRATVVDVDYGEVGWVTAVADIAPFDVVVSGFSIHHQPDARKRAVYGEIFDLLTPGGLFLNVEHVASPSLGIEALHENIFIDSLHAFHQANGSTQSRDEIAAEFYRRPDKQANILAPVEDQCAWLRELGYVDVDCYLKYFELAVFGGCKPIPEEGGS